MDISELVPVKPHAAIFDMDGVVVNSEPIHLRTLIEIFSKFGIQYDAKDHAARFAGTGSTYIISTVFREHGINADVERWVKKRSALYCRLLRGRRLRTIPGFGDLLRMLKRKGIKRAIASSGRRKTVLASLEAARLKRSDFSAIITKEDAKRRKPYPDAFLVAAKRLCARPRQCIAFEDSIAGVEAAKRAGMYCVALLTTTTRRRLKAAGADLIIKDFRDKRLQKVW